MILYLWQLPQNILGLILVILFRAKKSGDIYICNRFFDSAISLGNYIIFQVDCVSDQSIQHEYGHQRQSKMYGWFYLLVVGIPSIVRNIWDRLTHKEWTSYQRSIWYYGSFPEKQADKLGGVKRRI